MEANTDIFDELRTLSPLIAEIKKVNVFKVPEGYFDSIAATVMVCLGEEAHPNNFLEGQEFANVPDGYFARLADSILDKIKEADTASDETRNLSPMLYGIKKRHLHDVPEHYFDHLADAVLDKIKLVQPASEEIRYLSPMLNQLQNNNVFDTPSGYFTRFEQTINDQIKIVGAKQELKELSPVLYDMADESVFEVPVAYFATLSGIILNRLNSQAGKVVSMPRRNSFIKYAAAAMLTGVTALGIYKYVENPVAPNTHTNNAIALEVSIEKGKNMNEVQFNEALERLNDADIVKYLENNGDITDVTVLNNSLDEIKLPSQEEYLTDETTLDNYLKDIEKPAVNN